MLSKRPFYYNTLRNTVIAFGNLFNEIYIESEGKTIRVPLQYLPKEKFVQRINYRPELDDATVKVETTLPAMGFEMTNVAYDPERKTNKMNALRGNEGKMFNRTSYTADFTLYVGVRKMDEGFRIVEQILPYFTPELIVKIRDKSDYNISTNVPFVLNSSSFEVQAEDDFEERRSILWELQFTAKIYVYPDEQSSTVIRRTIVDIAHMETNFDIETYIAEVSDFEATKDDHTVVETWHLPGDKPSNINIVTRPDELEVTSKKTK
jgi:hypothetical protein